MVFVFLQSVLLYGVFPYVAGRVGEVMRSGDVYSLHFKTDGAFIAMSMVFLEVNRVRTVYLGAVDSTEDWERRMIPEMANFMASDEKPYVPGSIVLDESTQSFKRISQCLFHSQSTVVTCIDSEWLVSLVRSVSVRVFHGVEPLSVIEFLRVRFLSARGPSVQAKFPVLRTVINFCVYLQVKGGMKVRFE